MNFEHFNENNRNNRKKQKFSITELAGSFGDWGTLIPFIIGYVSLVGLNPANLFICLGITNIILGIKFNLPLPVQPQKTIGAVALAQKWSPSLVFSTGFGTGVVWFFLGISKRLNSIIAKVPTILVKGIQLGLGLILAWNAVRLMMENLFLASISIIIILVLYKFEMIPSAIVLVILGTLIIFINGDIDLSTLYLSIPNLTLHIPNIQDLIYGMIIAGIGQLFLTLTNVMIATIALVKELFPIQSKKLDANTLSINMGIINLVSPFFGGMPLCHGSGGVASQYAFGARTGGSMILEGMIEIILGVFFSNLLFDFFIAFPTSIFGSMLFYTAALLTKISFKDFNRKAFFIVTLPTAIICFFFNISIGFLIGLGLYLFLKDHLESY